MSADLQRFTGGYKDSFGFLRTALVGVTTWTDRQIRTTGIVVPHIDKGDVFSYNVQINHDRKLNEAGSDYHLHFMPVATSAAGEVIAIDFAWGWYNIGDTIPDTLPNTGTATYTFDADKQYCHCIVNIATNMTPPTGEMYSSFILIKCTRRNDGQDTHAGEIALLGADCHYKSDRVGSKFNRSDTA
jgi:hypothetical protein